MPNHEQESHAGEENRPLELNKETLQDLDVEATDADAVKGGTGTIYYVQPSGGYYAGSIVAQSMVKSGSVVPSGASVSGRY